MVKQTLETVNRIDPCYVGKDCVQVMLPYRIALTFFSKEGVMYHHSEGQEVLINQYLQDVRRKQFPYYNIPTHYEKNF